MNKKEKKVHWEGYKLGILHCVEFLINKFGMVDLSEIIVDNLLDGVSNSELIKLCKEQDIDILWSKKRMLRNKGLTIKNYENFVKDMRKINKKHFKEKEAK